MFDSWIVEDSFGRRWRLWLAAHGAPGGLPREGARAALEALVQSCLGGKHAHERLGFGALFTIHERLSGVPLSGRSSQPVDGATARRRLETVAAVLGRAGWAGRLRIERAALAYGAQAGGPARPASDRAPAQRSRAVVEEAPDTIRDAPSTGSPAPVLDWIGVVIRDEDGTLLSNVRCRITAPGRAPTEMTTDASGRLLLRSIESGSCAIELPDIDGREWSAGVGATS